MSNGPTVSLETLSLRIIRYTSPKRIDRSAVSMAVPLTITIPVSFLSGFRNSICTDFESSKSAIFFSQEIFKVPSSVIT